MRNRYIFKLAHFQIFKLKDRLPVKIYPVADIGQDADLIELFYRSGFVVEIRRKVILPVGHILYIQLQAVRGFLPVDLIVYPDVGAEIRRTLFAIIQSGHIDFPVTDL